MNSAYSYAYSFDPIGNRLSASLAGMVYAYTTNSLNQYTAVNAVVPTYDADGNMLTNGVWSYTWNGENRLIKAENATSGMKLEFDYDYMGRRIYKKVYENNTLVKHLKFVYDGYKLIEEFDGLNGDALVRRYVWQSEDFGLDVPVSVYDAAGNKTYFYHTDANKNITELSDENGGIVAHYEYSPFGSLTASSGEYAEENPFRFSSEYSDMETGLVYYNYRYYSPELGRWLSRDPIEEQGGYNLYGMVNNYIINAFDSKGFGIGKQIKLFCKKIWDWITEPDNLEKVNDGIEVLDTAKKLDNIINEDNDKKRLLDTTEAMTEGIYPQPINPSGLMRDNILPRIGGLETPSSENTMSPEAQKIYNELDQTGIRISD